MGSLVTSKISAKHESKRFGVRWNLDSYAITDAVSISLDNYLYEGLVGYGQRLDLALFGPSSPFSGIILRFEARNVQSDDSSILFYVFQPETSGPLYLYARNLQAIAKGDLSIPIGKQFSLILSDSEVSLQPIITYPERERVTGKFSVKRLRLESIDRDGKPLTWFTAGSNDRDAFISSIGLGQQQGVDIILALQSVRLGKAILGYESDCNGSVTLSYNQDSSILGLTGNLTFSGLSTTLSADINLESLDLQRVSLRVASGQKLDLSNEISVIAGDWSLSYSKDSSSSATKRLYSLLANRFQLNLGNTALIVGGKLSCSVNSDIESTSLQIEHADISLQELLTIPIGELYLQVGKGSQISIEREPSDDPNKSGDLAVKLSGTVSLLEKVKGEPATGEPLFQFSVAPDQPISWSESTGFQMKGRFDLPSFDAGPFVVGKNAHVTFTDQSITIDPDLKLDSKVFSIFLKPIHKPLDLLFSPLINPMLDLLGKEIPLPADLRQTLKPKKWYEWGNVEWNLSIKTADDIYKLIRSSFIKLLESDRKDRWADGKLQTIDILNFSLETLWSLAQSGALSKLATSLGLDQDVANAFRDMPQPKLAEKLQYLDKISELIQVIAGYEIKDNLELVDLSDFRFTIDYRQDQAVDTSLSAQLAKEAQSAISKGIAELGDSGSLLKSLTNLSQELSVLEAPSDNGLKVQAPSITPFIQLPFFADLLGTFKALVNDKPFSLVEIGVNSSLKLGFAYSQIIDLLPYIGFPLPLTFGLDTRLAMELNPALGLSTKRSTLQKTAKDVIDVLSGSTDQGFLEKTKQALDIVGQLLFPPSNGASDQSDPYGLYLTHPQNRPLLRLNPEMRLNAGIDYGLIGLRAYTGLGADFGVSIAKTEPETNSGQAGKLYLADVAQAIKPLLSASQSPNPEGWMTGTLQSLGNLISLFDYRLQAYIPWGIEPKLPTLGWIKDLPYVTGKITLPAIQASSGKIAFAGPVRGGTVHFDRRIYTESDFEGAGDFLLNMGQEQSSSTDATGRFDLVLDIKSSDANQDGEVTFKDGLIIVTTSGDPQTCNHLIDSITGLDLGHPLVGLPGHNVSMITTLKYMMLGRWSPSSTVCEPDGERVPLTPELINELMKRFLGAPEGVLDDDFDPYLALQGSAAEQEVAISSLMFTYEQIFLIRAVANLLKQLRPDYSSSKLWGLDSSRVLDPDLADSIPMLATTGWGYALTQLFGYVSISKADSPALKENHDIFNLTDSSHLRLFFETILAAYPTRELWSRYASMIVGDLATFQQVFANAVRAPQDLPDHAQARADLLRNYRSDAATVKAAIDRVFGPSLDALATGFVAIVQAFRQQVALATKLSDSLPGEGAEMLIPAIAGIKRELIAATIPSLVSRSLSPSRGPATSDPALLSWLSDALTKPLTVDSSERDFNYAIRFANQPVQRQANRLAIRVQLVTAHGDRDTNTIEPVPAPDYGLTVRARLGGNARLGIDYGLVSDQPGVSPSLVLLRFAPGADEAWLELELNPSSLDGISPLNLQLQLLNADSGVAIDAAQSVLNFPLTRNGQDATVLAESSFTLHEIGSGSLETRNRSDGSGLSGKLHKIRPTPSDLVLPHIAAFNPDSDQITVDAAAILELRRRTFAFSPSDEEVKELDETKLKALIQVSWEKHLSLQDHDLAIVAGVLLDQPSGKLLATVSAPPNAAGQAPAWSQLFGGTSLRFSKEPEQSIELGGQFYAAGTSLILAFESNPSPLPWGQATTLAMTDPDGRAAKALTHIAGAAAGQAVGYSPYQQAVVQLPTSTGNGLPRFWLQPYNNPGAGFELIVSSLEYDRRRLELVLPDGSVWGQLISDDPTLLAAAKAPDLLLRVDPTSSQQGLNNLTLVPAGFQLESIDPDKVTNGLVFERSTDGGKHWAATTANQRGLTEGVYMFRTRQQQQDGTVLFGSVLSLRVNKEGNVEPQQFTSAPSRDAALPKLGSPFDLSLQIIGPDKRQILGFPLDQYGTAKSQHARQLGLKIRLMREANLDNHFAFALLRKSDAQLIDCITGEAIGSILELDHFQEQGYLDSLVWHASRHGEAIDLTSQIRLGAGIDLLNHCLVPLLQVDAAPTTIFSSIPDANPDSRQHVLSFSGGVFGFEDQLDKQADWDMDDALIQVLSLGLTNLQS